MLSSFRLDAGSQIRTDDPAIFSRVLYQLSYPGRLPFYPRRRANVKIWPPVWERLSCTLDYGPPDPDGLL